MSYLAAESLQGEAQNFENGVQSQSPEGDVNLPLFSRLQAVSRTLLAAPNSEGSFILLSDITYDPISGADILNIRIKTTSTGASFSLPAQQPFISPFWLEGSYLVWGTFEGGSTRLWWLDASKSDSQKPREFGTLKGLLTNLRAEKLPSNQFALVFALSDLRQRDGTLRGGPIGSGKLYDTYPVRFGKSYRQPDTVPPSIYSTILSKKDSLLQLHHQEPVDLLADTQLDFGIWPQGQDFVVGARGLLFTAAHTETALRFLQAIELYFLGVDWQNTRVLAAPQKLGRKEWTGSPSSFTFSPDGSQAMFLQSERLDASFSHDSIFLVDLMRPEIARCVTLSPAVASVPDDRSWPPRILTAHWDFQDPNIVYVIIDETANMSIWKVCIGSEPASEDLKGVALLIMQDGCISFSCSLESAPFQVKLFILRSTFYRSAVVEVLILDANMLPKVHTVEQSSIPGFSGPPYESTYFSGAADSKVHLFIHKPKGFKPGSRYPLIIMIHGGPNDAWRNSWSPTWNPILWTDQGYVVITPNIAGSTGFGLPFALSIYQSWGGRTLSDLEHLFSFIEESLSYIDPSRVIGAGYSFGGYMMNWLAGQGLAARFCAFIVHAGVFSVPNLLGGDLPTAYKPDFGCFPWEDGEKWSEWNPSKLCGNWNTPMLFTHGDMDYRIPLTESLSAYHTCQIRGIQSQLLVFPDEGHTIAKPINRSQWHETMLKWAAQWSAK